LSTTPKPTLAVQAPAPSSGRSILVVDDEPALLRTFERVLRGTFDVVTCSNTDEAISLVTSRSFDVVVSDVHMPQMSGVDLLRIIRAYDFDVPVILITGAPSVETAADAVALGAAGYLIKPFENDALIKACERASRLHKLAKMKRDALKLNGGDDVQPADLAGLSASFERALDGMWVAFQPIVDGHKVIAYEALLRSNEAALPNPGAVLDAAERLGRLHDVGRHVRELAADAFSKARGDALLFLNLHTQDLLDASLYASTSPLSRFADRVVLEVTERASLDAVKDVGARISVLRYGGYRIAVDDLGAGYAGLSSFVSLEPEFVKLDMSLVRNVHRSNIRERLVTSMTSLCLEMNIRVIAEGVETIEERDCVKRAGCDLQQGYFFARPGPAFPTANLD
jgi:EAL domain-containing protein (putative c-di-GMP-specific phosphodiesterase class I)